MVDMCCLISVPLNIHVNGLVDYCVLCSNSYLTQVQCSATYVVGCAAGCRNVHTAGSPSKLYLLVVDQCPCSPMCRECLYPPAAVWELGVHVPKLVNYVTETVNITSDVIRKLP